MGVIPSDKETLAFAAARIVELGGEEGEIGRWVAAEAERRQAAVDEARHVPVIVNGEALEIGQLYRVTWNQHYYGRDQGYPPRVREHSRMRLHGRLLNGNVAFRRINRRHGYGDDSWTSGRYGRGGYEIIEDRDILSARLVDEESITPGIRRLMDQMDRGFMYSIPRAEE